MTTIAFDGKILAADSYGSDDYMIEQFAFEKIFDTPSHYVAICGAYSKGLEFVEWFRKSREPKPSGLGEPKPKDLDDMNALVVEKTNGACEKFEKNCLSIPWKAPTAIGCGREVAMGVLLHGGTAIEAVEIAKKVNPGTGGAVQWVDVMLMKRGEVNDL